MNGNHTADDLGASVEHVFDQFVSAVTCKAILTSFSQLVDLTGLRHVDHSHFYEHLKARLAGSWKAKALWAKLDKRATHRDYKRGQACKDIRVLIIGAGPCGLRTAIECALLGAKTVIVEKRDRFSRNNVLHLWPYLITDLRNLGAKKFFGKFCAGAIDHISIRQLQCILMKAALLLGVEIHVNVSFESLIEPPEDQSTNIGWRCKVTPEDHALSEYIFDVLIGADGKRNTLPGFNRKEFRGKLAIAITANFINRNTQAEARVEEISGVAFIFNQKFFLDLKESTRIDLENIVYYKDDTHYFVMTAKKASLLEKGVLKEDYADTVALLDRSNVNQEALLNYAREAANFSTNYQLPSLDYAVNHYGQADVAMFDFTSMFAAESASRFLLKNGHHLLMGLVGDSLLEPFWPTGSGCARGFLGAFDAAWMIRSWAMGKSPGQVLAERESIYTVLSQTTPNYLHKNYNQYSIDPNTRYPNLNIRCVKPHQVKHLYEGGVIEEKEEEEEVVVPVKKPRSFDPNIDSYSLLRWCQRVLNTGKYRDVHVVDFTNSWRSGLALCALIHSFRPDIIDNSMLMECEVAVNNQLAFNVAEKELGILPVMSGEDMAKHEVPDKLTMVAYLAQFYELFKQEPLPSTVPLPVKAKRKSGGRDQKPTSPRSPNRRISFLAKLSAKLAKSKKRKDQEEKEERSPLGLKKLKERQEEKPEIELTRYCKLPMDEIANRLQLDRRDDQVKVKTNEDMMGAVSVTAMADLLVAKFKSYEPQAPPEPIRKLRGQPTLLAATPESEFCFFCHKRVYIMERMSAEGQFFHRGCFKCDYCGAGLRLNNYASDKEAKPIKFYCYRHALPEMRLRPQRKRGLEEEVKENVPMAIVTPAPDVDTGQSKEKSPRKTPPAPLASLLSPLDTLDKPSKTPERVEFEISFDGQEEESEEEQFEHNLRASLSSDTLLDDEDSDSDLSESDIDELAYISESEMARILDEWSGAEDEVWENAVESLKAPGTPLTLEEACELVGSWRRQHSREDLAAAEEEEDRRARRHSAKQGYTRLQGERLAQDDGSSTEVEEDSDFPTDSSEDDEDESESKTEPAEKFMTPEGHFEDQVKTPTSPVSRLSASKANFFSVPPTVVSLDPWSMFGMGNKGQQEVAEKKGRKKSDSSSCKSVRKKSEDSRGREDLSSKDTDVSDSLELDEGGERYIGSLDELRDNLDNNEEEEEEIDRRRSGSVESEGGRAGRERVQYSSSPFLDDEEGMEGITESDKGSEGDDEREEKEEEEREEEYDEEEQMEKTAVSLAMEQLLLDIDHKSQSKDSTAENILGETTDSGENEVFIEGRLSPSASKTRKFRMKRHARRSRERRSSSALTTSESEARTDHANTDQLRSSLSRSPSMEDGKLDHLLAKAEGDTQDTTEPLESRVDQGSVEKVCGDVSTKQKSISELGNDTVVLSGNISERKPRLTTEPTISTNQTVILSDTEKSNLDLELTDTGDVSLQEMLENVAALPDLSDNSDIDSLVFANVDDRYVTDRRKKKSRQTKVTSTTKKPVESFKVGDQAEHNSSFSISTPSGSQESVSSLDMESSEFKGQILEIEPGDDDIKPDEEMLRDYQTTMSLALGESLSDEPTEDREEEEETKKVEEKEEDGQSDQEKTDLVDTKLKQKAPSPDIDQSQSSSIYVTPDVSANDSTTIVTPSPTQPTRRPLPQPRVPYKQPTKETKDPRSPTVHIPTPTFSEQTPVKSGTNRESSGSEIFLSPVESFSSPPALTSKQPVSVSKPVSLQTMTKPSITQDSSHKDRNESNTSVPPPSSTPVTTSIPSSSSSTTKSTTSSEAKPAQTSPGSESPSTQQAGKIQRRLPDLPKLSVPSRQAVPPTDPIMDQPAMCSSPKPSSRVSGSVQVQRSQGRPLPIPSVKSSTQSSTKTSVASSVKSMSSPSFTKPPTPPVFKPPGKTRIALDKSKLRLGSSMDKTDSDVEADKKKKISADGIVIGNPMDDIPFADDSEVDEKFYTPMDPGKMAKPKFPHPEQGGNAKKRILPSPPNENGSTPSTAQVSKDKVREMRELDREKAKLEARERARLKSDEELGVRSVHGTPSRLVARTPGRKPTQEVVGKNVMSDTPSTSDVLSDSDDTRLSSVPTSSATEGDRPKGETTHVAGKKEKKKAKTPKKHKEKKKETRETDSDLESKKKRKSLLALILPTKDSEKSPKVTVTESDSTPKGSDDNGKSKKKNKAAKSKRSKDKSSSKKALKEDIDKTPTAETKLDLAICSVFSSEASKRSTQDALRGNGVRKTVPLAPRASVDELSDSDESHISFSTMQRRRDEDLDERVARRLRKIQLKQQKQAEQKRLRMAQEIQRQLEEVEVRQKELEERGIAVEKALRGDSPEDEDVDEGQLMSEWFTLVHEKNALLRYESELNMRAKELELEDRQARLESTFREKSKRPDTKTAPVPLVVQKSEKTSSDIVAEGHLLDELLEVVEQRNSLVAMLEEDRLREQKEDSDLKEMMHKKGFVLSPLSYDTRRERQKIEAPLASLAL